jgi:DNA-directed RNA polymerase sigma subunit (sigma70/sigma32)
MPGRTTSLTIKLSHSEREELQRRARSMAEPHRVVVRAQVILDLSEGRTLASISEVRGLAKRIVRKWGARFEKQRLAGLEDAARSGRPPRFSPLRGHRVGEARM